MSFLAAENKPKTVMVLLEDHTTRFNMINRTKKVSNSTRQIWRFSTINSGIEIQATMDFLATAVRGGDDGDIWRPWMDLDGHFWEFGISPPTFLLVLNVGNGWVAGGCWGLLG